jgi:hypothetical protein
MTDEQLEQLEAELQDMGPVDYVVLAWPAGVKTRGEVAPLIVNLVDRGIIRILDIAFIAKDADGNVEVVDLEHLGPGGEFAEFEGASSGLLDFEDMTEAAADLEPNSAAAILVWENRWAAPVAMAIRRSGGLLIDGGRIPVQGILAALDALEAAEAQN